MLDAHVRQKIIDVCSSRPPGTYHITIPVDSGSLKFFVKCGHSTLVSEARTQEYVLALAKFDPQAPGVPEVYDVFHHNYITYLVMEDVPVPSFRAWIDQEGFSAEERDSRLAIATEKIAAVVSWLLDCPPPGDGKIGPIGGGCMYHDFFCKEEAALEFFTLLALEVFANKALSRLPGRTLRTVTLANERLVIGHSDINLNNFLYDHVTRRVWMVDYQYVNVVPESLVSFALHVTTHSFVKAVAEKVDFPQSTQLEQLELAAISVMQSANKTLGLDGYGNPKPHRRRPGRNRSTGGARA